VTWQPRPLRDVTCRQCGVVYQSRGARTFFCSSLCFTRASRERLKATHGPRYLADIHKARRAKGLCIHCNTTAESSRLCDRCRQDQRDRNAKYTRSLRRQVLEAYGGCCQCCGESGQDFLTIDHIHNDGAYERQVLKLRAGSKLNLWLKRNGFPKDRYQLLCYNCNCAKGAWGVCPHKEAYDD
jgi:hypothetical protein